ncbi:MAG: transporter [Nocardioides sp.]|nr:transporter [Nocardioides sp.]
MSDPTPTATLRLRDLDPRVHRLFLGFAFSALGSGLTLPFLYVYLAEVRGIETATVGWIFAWMGLLGFAAAPVGGSLIDRYGPRPVMIVGLVVEAVCTASIGLVETPAEGFLVASFIVVGTVGLWPAATAMLTRLVPLEARERVYGVNFMLLNAGLGIGGVLSSLVIDTESVGSFQRLYLLDGLTYLAYIVVLVTLPRGTGAMPTPDDPLPGAVVPELEQASWSVVVRDRTLLRIVAISILLITFGYAQMEAGLAAYAVTVAEIPARALGWAYAANTGAIVCGQLLALRLINGRRRTTMLALCGGIWSVSWLVIAWSDAVDGWVAVAAIVLGLGLFGLGETLFAPVAPAIVNGLAREDMRGRYNALQGMTWTVGSIVGPASAGLLIGHGHPGIWVSCVVGGTALAAVLFLNLRRHLTDAQDGLVASA